MKSLGDYDASAVIYGKFTTYRPSTGAAFTLGGTPALSVYKDNSTTQSTTGVTLTVDFDSVTGLNHFAIDTSADGTFYSAGSFFDIVITTGTVDSISVVGAVVASFTIRKNSSLKPTTAGQTLDVSSGGEAGVDWGNVGNKTTTNALTGTTIATTQKVDVETVKTQAVTCAAGVTVGAFVGQGTAAIGVNVSGHVSRVVLTDTVTTYTGDTPQTGDSFARIGATGGGLTSLAPSSTALSTATWTGTLATNLTTLAGHDPGATLGTSTLTQTQVTGGAYALNSSSFAFNSALDLTTTQKASVNAECDTALSDVGLTAVITGRIDAAISTRLASASYTTPPTVTQIRQEMDSNSTDLDSIGLLATAINAKTTNLPASPAATSDIPTVSQIWATALTESYASDGSTFTGAQALYMVWSALSEFAIAGTTITCKKLDGSTTSMTFTLDDATTPTGRTRAT